MACIASVNEMITAPKDGSRILLKYHTRFARGYCNWVRAGEKWEECRWIDNKETTGSDPHWEPWCGNENSYTTEHIDPSDCISWIKL